MPKIPYAGTIRVRTQKTAGLSKQSLARRGLLGWTKPSNDAERGVFEIAAESSTILVLLRMLLGG